MFKVWELKILQCALCTMVTKDKIVLVENVGGVDGPPTFENVTTNSSHMENVHLKLGNSMEIKYYNLQLHKFKLPHHCVSIF
jgi:hypothetical protein